MKKTMRYLSMAALALVGAIVAGCSSSDDIIDDTPQQPKDNIVTMKTTVGLEGGGETRALDPATGVKTFAVGEQLSLWFTNKDGREIAINSNPLTAEDITSNGKSANFTFVFEHPRTNPTPDKTKPLRYFYPGSYVFQSFGQGNDDIFYTAFIEIYTSQGGTLEEYETRDDWAIYEGPWDGENLPSGVTLENQMALLAITFKDDATGRIITGSLMKVEIDIENGKTYTVPCNEGNEPLGHDTLYMAIFPDDIKSKDVFHVTATDGTTFYSKTLRGKNYEKGHGYNITWRMTNSMTTPLTMEARSDGTIVVNNPRSGMQFSLNGGAKTTMTTTTTINVNTGDKVQFYGNGESITHYGANSDAECTSIAGGTASVKVYGNIMSLVDETGFATAELSSSENDYYIFRSLFHGNTTLTDASTLLLPSTTLNNYCYQYMFFGCTNLTNAPSLLPAEDLRVGCYKGMFQDCISLTEAPKLPAPMLVSQCYEAMFSGCSSLSSVTCLATSGINSSNSTTNWMSRVAGGGTFYKAASVPVGSGTNGRFWPTGENGIPEDWNVDY